MPIFKKENYNYILSKEEIYKIKSLYIKGYKVKDIAKKYGFSSDYIGKIIRNNKIV